METITATPASARSTLGVPFIPPASVSEQSTRLRNVLVRLQRRLAPPPVQILESALALLDHRVLVVLCAAGVPEALDRPMSVGDLAALLETDAVRLDRLLRFACARGWVRVDRRQRFRPTELTTFLRRDHPAGWRAWVDFVGSAPVVHAVAALALTDTIDGFAEANGQPFFDFLRNEADLWTIFDAAMAAGARMHALTLDKAIKWGSTRTICDVGGGTGELVRTLLDRHPSWEGAVLDRPDVIDRAVRHPRLNAVSGDAFVSVPAGSDVYLLVNVIHDWNDDDAVTILCNVAHSCGSLGRLLVIENERRPVPRDDLALRADVLMASLTNGGRERTREEFERLGQRAGLHLVRTTRLGSGDRAFEFAVRRPT